ncbi:hypothetical protein AMQ84_00280 [Paenibacillus riograndensis]|uniref:Transposase n=2 Tax=Paenibacillus riograndensis TaxID=483937 RepID=A0A132UD55_9BACL|nr:hypothetical protein [Paenibacillus riograndensis]KWX81326.1 hypothetical protein AMQ84_00280 [Paenibacillus riograndensis]KWX88468.1 hypothetical protein AMQ83_06555 [Paenibacillus riograndensis]
MKAVLVQCAWAASKSKNNRLSAMYSRIVKRAGKQKAIVALAHAMIRIMYVMLRDKVPYTELGTEYLNTPEQTANYLIKKLQKLGYQVELTPTT